MSNDTGSGLPPLVGLDDRIILFDGVCNLCNGSVQFLLRFDRRRAFRLAAIQSPEGQAIMKWFGFSTGMSGTMLLVEGGRVSTRSTAVLRIASRLPFPWWLSGIGWIVPRIVRDWAYDIVARNRYRWFGRRETCLVPGPEHEGRFLDTSRLDD
ncbi:MAG: thiol-disulfide oxidoreductase DCC family protein [Candidatus Eisenbacteria bacterium]|nr:thiol-disulfide oxidoreductase DCC family protein [Candidatus Eisenbacteria bacterium]